VITALRESPSFKFNELDAFIIASKRKIGVLNSMKRFAETLPLSHRIKELLDDYEQHPDKYHDGSHREPKDSTKRADYIRFYRSQAQNFVTAAYAALGERGSMEETFYEIESTVRDATTREAQCPHSLGRSPTGSAGSVLRRCGISQKSQHPPEKPRAGTAVNGAI